MSDRRRADIEHLQRMFPKLETLTIQDVYDQQGRDVEKCIPVLLNLITSSSASSRYVTTSGEHDSYDWDSGLRVVSDAIESVGAAVTSGLASLAQGFTSWMGDLGSDLEELTLGALLGDEEEENRASSSKKSDDRNVAQVVHSSNDSANVMHRGGRRGVERTPEPAPPRRRDSDPDERHSEEGAEDSDDYYDDDRKKDE